MEFVCKATNDEKGITNLDCTSTQGNDIDPHLFKGGVKVNIHDAKKPEAKKAEAKKADAKKADAKKADAKKADAKKADAKKADSKKVDAKSGCGCTSAANAEAMVSATAPPDCSCFEQASISPMVGTINNYTFSNGTNVRVVFNTVEDAGDWTATGPGVRALSTNGFGNYNNNTYDGTVLAGTIRFPEGSNRHVLVCVDTRVPPTFGFQLRGERVNPGNRTYDWSLEASADPVTVAIDETYFDNVNFTATADYLDSYQVEIPASVINTSSESITVTGFTVQPNAGLSVDQALPFSVLPGTSTSLNLQLRVQTKLSSQTFTVSATAQSGAPGCELPVTESRVATIMFSPTNLVDQNAILSFNGVNTTLSAPHSGGSVSYTGSQQIGPYAACGEFTVTASGTLTATGSGNQTTASVDIPVSVPCATGCTLSQGYWKTHSQKGPAPYDPTWALIQGQEDAQFFQSGQSYYQVLNTPPRGNVYYILAVQYIAAELNTLKGTSVPPDVAAVYQSAQGLLNKYTPAQVASLSTQDPDKLLFNSDAKALEQYNSGLAGVPACNQNAAPLNAPCIQNA